MMELGPELDCLVAKKIMGWKSTTIQGNKWWRVEPQRFKQATGPSGMCWSPSTNIAHAWEVVEHMAKRGHDLKLTWRRESLSPWPASATASFRAPDVDGPHPVYVLCETAPHAISMAALKAVERP